MLHCFYMLLIAADDVEDPDNQRDILQSITCKSHKKIINVQ